MRIKILLILMLVGLGVSAQNLRLPAVKDTTLTTTTSPATPSWRTAMVNGKRVYWLYNSTTAKYDRVPMLNELRGGIDTLKALIAAVPVPTLQSVLAAGNTANNSAYLKTVGSFTGQKKFVGFGDSFMFGTGASSPWLRWFSIFCQWNNFQEINNGISGTFLEKRTPIQSLNMVDRISEIPVYDTTYAGMVIAYTENDIIFNYTNYTPANTISDLTTIVNASVAKGWPASILYLVGPYWHSPTSNSDPVGNGPANQQRYKDFNTAVKTAATNNGTKYFDAYNWGLKYGGNSLNFTDSTHVGNNGHKVYATGFNAIYNYQVPKKDQTLAANGIVEFNQLRVANSDTAATNHTLFGLDSTRKVVIIPNGYIRNSYGYTQAQAASVNINGIGSFGGKLTSLSDLSIANQGVLGWYLNLKVSGNAYPTSRSGSLWLAQGGISYHDTFGSTPGTANEERTNTISGSANTFGSGLFTVAGVTTVNNIFNNASYIKSYGSGYPATALRQGLVMYGQNGASGIDAFTGANAATTLSLQGQGHGLVEVDGDLTVKNTRTLTVVSNLATFGGGIGVGGSGYPATSLRINSLHISGFHDEYSPSTANLGIAYNLQTQGHGDVNIGGNTAISAPYTFSVGGLSTLTGGATVARGIDMTSVGGFGYVAHLPQTTKPTTPASGWKYYVNSTNQVAFLGTDGFVKSFILPGAADRVFKWQNKSYTAADSADVAALQTAAANYVTTNTNQLTGLTGQKTWDGQHIFNVRAYFGTSNIISIGNGQIYFGNTTAGNQMTLRVPTAMPAARDLVLPYSNVSATDTLALKSDIQRRTPIIVAASATMALNADYLNPSATQYNLTLPACGLFTADGSRIITVLATGTGGAKIVVPSGYSMQSGTSFATTTGTGGATLTQGQKVQLIPVGTNSYVLQPLNGSVTLY